ncbi:MAG: hypothetical protein QOE66_2347, partial [Chloroflexota bacterium]|nr:hypothetical protein [Chloroflexota bacterium]
AAALGAVSVAGVRTVVHGSTVA